MKEKRVLTNTHKLYQQALHCHDFNPVIGYGSAGTGKTYGALQAAVKQIQEGKVKHIIIARPNVSFADTNGFLPGDAREKLDPWIQPIIQNLRKLGISNGTIESWEKNGVLQFHLLEHIQGLTFDNSFVIVDECQNMTFEQMKVFLCRTGEYSRVVFAGDIAQISPKFKNSGMAKILYMIDKMQLRVHTLEFTRDDVVRGRQCKMWIEAFEDFEAGNFPDPVKEVA